jgi:dTDP-4-dehydrorhamnose 3,5-epimerase
MRFRPATLADAVIVEQERHSDARGYFARTFCADEFAAAGLPTSFPQISVSFNAKRGTLRGMHLQREPHGEPKLVRCTRGAVFDAIVDLRAGPGFGRWFAIELTEENGTALYIPPGFAHGFQCLSDETELLYLIGTRFVPEAAAGLRWDDPDVGIAWPRPVSVISDRDRDLPTIAQFAAANGPGPTKAPA